MLQFIERNQLLLFIGVALTAFASIFFMRSRSMEICGTLMRNEHITGLSWMDDGCYLTIKNESGTYRIRGTPNQMYEKLGSPICVETLKDHFTKLP